MNSNRIHCVALNNKNPINNHLQNPKSKIRNPKSFLVVISVSEKTIKKGNANQRRHDDNVSDIFRVQHVILQCVYCILHRKIFPALFL
jgi:hypothetical protein